MAEIYLLRHGETEWNRDGNRYCGMTDIQLSAIGRQQAARASEFLKGVRFQAVYASPLVRSHETAKIVAGTQNLSVQIDQRIREIDFGSWEGIPKDVLVKENSTIWQAWADDPTEIHAGETGESASQVFNRAREFFEEISIKHNKESVLVVGHNTLNRIFISGSLSAPFRSYRKIKQSNTGITVFSMKQDIEFVHINLHEHLAPGFLHTS